MSKRQDDKRRHARCDAVVCAWLRFRGDDAALGVRTHNLSPEGAMFSALKFAARGEPLLLHVELPHGAPPLECKARVCWSRLMPNGLYRFGVRFLDLRQEERETLESLLASMRPGPALAAV